MNPERRQRIESLFEAALERRPGERGAFLAEAAGHDPELHREVVALLEAHDHAGGILEQAPVPAAALLSQVSPADAPDPAVRRVIGVGLALLGFFGLGALALWLAPRLDLVSGAPLALGAVALAALIAIGLIRASAPDGRVFDLPLPWRDPARTPAPSDDALAAGSRVAHYIVHERLGVGGMGVVYRAKDTRLDRHVALKFLPAHLSADDEARDRFLVEAQAAAALDHPNLCTVHEIGSTEDGRLYIAMAYYDGETVKEKLEGGALTPEEASDIATQVARGLRKAHERGIVHRDIKPANIFVTADGIAKVLDFGVAKLSGVELTRTGATVGTVSYMSPEQIRGEAVSARTDVWALGVVLYEMLSGRRPFEAEETIGVLHSILELDPPPLRRLRPDLPPEIETVVERCLVKDVVRRCPDMDTLIRVLEAVGSPPSRRTPGPAAGQGVASGSDLASEGERRIACIVVTRIDRYAQILERVGPERLDEMSGRWRQEIARIAESYDGVLNGWSGDGGVALFGIPTAQEDSLARGVRAALAMHSRIRELSAEMGLQDQRPPRLRTGIASGPLIARPAEEPDRRFRVAGEILDIADRLAGHAAADEVLIEEDCQALATPFFEIEPAEPVSIRAAEDPMTPYRVLGSTGVQTRIDAAESQGLTEYTGRDDELETLQDLLRDAVAGRGGFVSVVGEAGVGKSRLLLELRKSVDRREVLVLRGRCASFGGGLPYQPFVEALRSRLGLDEDGQGEPDVDRVAGTIRTISADLEEFIPFYLHLLSLESGDHPIPPGFEGESLRLAITDALAAIFTLGALERPTLLLLEDWHWADRASAEILLRLAEMAAAYPLMIVATTRPDPGVEWGTPARHRPIYLGPLTPEGSATIVRRVLGATELPDDLAETLHDRTGGNPFFLEEVCRALKEAGTVRISDGRARLTGSVDALDLPDNVQGVLRARLDRLAPDVRRVVRHASVIGREFPRAILERTLDDDSRLDDALESLRVLGLVQQTRVLPDRAYQFKHVLTLEAAYESLIEHQRRSLHGAVGEAIEELYADRLDEHLERLAHHFSRAEDATRAVRYGLQAAEKAHSLSRFDESLEMLDEVLEWVRNLPSATEREETRLEILFRQERLCETLGLRTRQREIIEELLDRLGPLGDGPRLARAHLRAGDHHTLTRRFDDAERELRESLRIARSLSEATAERAALQSLGLLYWYQGRHREAIEMAEAALSIDRERGDLEGVIADLSNLGNIYKGQGEYERALDCLFEAEELIERASAEGAGPLTYKLSYILHNIGNLYRVLGDNEQAFDYLRRASSYDTGYLTPIQKSFHLTAMAHIRLQQGQIEESLELYGEAVEVCRKARVAEGLSQSLRALGTVLLTLERYEEALPCLTEAARVFGRLHDTAAEAATWHAAATACERLDRRREGMDAWNRVRDLAAATDDAGRQLEAAEGLARLARPDDPERARRHYEEALELARSLEDREREASLLNSLGILHWNSARYPQALGCYADALEIYRILDDRPHAGLMLNSLAATLRKMGRPQEATVRLREAMELHEETGERLLQAHALTLLAELRREAGDLEESAILLGRSLELRRELGDRLGEGWMLYRLAPVQAALGAREAARSSAAEASRIAAELENGELSQACQDLNL